MKTTWPAMKRFRMRPTPSLRFSPYAWAKLLYLRDRGDTEIGGFGLSDERDPLLVVDVLTVKQLCTAVTVAFDDIVVADLFDELVDRGLKPERFARIWIHTHPGDCPLPSSVDEETFARVFGRTNWSVMAIFARNDASYARLSFHAGPGGAMEISVAVDYRVPFAGSDFALWEAEYVTHVVEESPWDPLGFGCLDDMRLFDELEDDFWKGTELHDDAARVRSV